MLSFALGGFISNACAGIVMGALFVAPAFGLLFLVQGVPFLSLNILHSTLISAMIGGYIGSVCGTLAMGLVGLLQGLFPRRLPHEIGFDKHYFGLLWGSVICLICGFFTGAIFIAAFHFVGGGTRANLVLIANVGFGYWMIGCYALGCFVGALAPSLPLWFLRRMGEMWGRVRRLTKNTTGGG
jgi:hypothetical protein